MNTQDDRAKLREMIDRFDSAMLVTHGDAQGGTFHSRPMAIADVDDDLGLWFLSDQASGKVLEIEERADVQLVFQDDTKFVAVSGVATVSKDRAKLEEVWNPEYQAWFPNGKDDPNIVLIHVQPQEAEYWDQSGGKRFEYVAQAVKAIATGSRPRISKDQHGKARL